MDFGRKINSMKQTAFYTALLLLVTACSETNSENKELSNNSMDKDTVEVQTNSTATGRTKKSTETHISTSPQEDELIDLIGKLPEIKRLGTEIEKNSKGEHHLALRVSSEPSDDQEYYGISVAEDNGDALVNYYTFYIYPGNEIFYYDPIEDRELSLDEWRKQK